MANIVITKTGEIVSVIFNDKSTIKDKKTENSTTGRYVALLKGASGISTNIFGNDKTYTFEDFDTINAVSITDNNILFNQLEILI